MPGESGVRIVQTDSGTATEQTAAKVLSVDAEGDLVLEHTTIAVKTINSTTVDFDGYTHHWLELSSDTSLDISGSGIIPFVTLRVKQTGTGDHTLTLTGQVDVLGISYAPGIGADKVTFYQFGWDGANYQIIAYYTN